MFVLEGKVVSLEGNDGFVLVRVYGFYDLLSVRILILERVIYGFVVGDWVRFREE